MYLYVVEGEDDLRKIGRAVLPERRLGVLRSGSSRPISLCHTREVEPHEGAPVERFAHWLLREKRVQGEWFRVTKKEACAAIEAAVVAVRNGERPGKMGGKSGRKLQYPEKFLASFAAGTLDRIRAALGEKEDTRAFIREAVEREIKRRSRQKN